MNSTPTHSPTPAIDALLTRVRRRLVREVWAFGLGRALFASSLWLLFMFLVDWGMHVPAGVRAVNFAIMLGLPLAVVWRELWLRLRAVPDRAGLAVLLERAHPDLHELLVSAVQLNGQRAGAGDPALIAKVIAEAEARAVGLSLDDLTDPLPPRRSLGLGALSSLAVAVTFLLQADAARIFLARIAGGSTPWPQRTHLILEIPLAGELLTTRESLAIDVARGSDLPIIVRSEGQVPSEVTVHFEGGHTALLGSAGRGVFRTLLRSVQEDMAFHITGGDDTDGWPALTIRVLQPPDVSGIAIRVLPPAYTGLDERLEFDRDVQVPAASKITVFMRSDPVDATGVVRMLPQDRQLDLYPARFPGAAGGKAQDSLAFDWIADKDLRYRFELLDSTGLANPDPGLYAIAVQADRPPTVEVFAPARGEVESVIGGALPLKALCSDDYGLSGLSWRAVATTAKPASPLALDSQKYSPLEFTQPTNPEALEPTKVARVKSFASRSIDINSLFGDSPPVEGEVFQLELRASDNREPSVQESTSAAVRVRIISTDEFLRHTQDRLARVRARVEALSQLMADKQGDTQDLVASMESDEPGKVDALSIRSNLGAARRIEGDSRAISREVTSVVQALLWSRIDDRADLILAELERSTLAIADRNFHGAPWLNLYRMQQENRLGDADFADKLVEIAGIAVTLSETSAPAVVAGLRRSMDIVDLTAQYDILLKVTEEQAQTRVQVEQLLSLLSDWDSYQSLLSATRDLLNGQTNLLNRTRQFYKEN